MPNPLHDNAKPKSGYHHGDLRAELIREGIRQLERGGIADLSLRQLAKSVGVTGSAPYRHFPDRRALLEAIAAEGYRRVAATLAPSGVRAAEGARRMVLFADEHPAWWELMAGCGSFDIDDVILRIGDQELAINGGAEAPERWVAALARGLSRYLDAPRLFRGAVAVWRDPLAGLGSAARGLAFLLRSAWGGFGWLKVWPGSWAGALGDWSDRPMRAAAATPPDQRRARQKMGVMSSLSSLLRVLGLTRGYCTGPPGIGHTSRPG